MNSIDFNLLKIFIGIVEAGNLTRAEAKLNIPKPTLSRNLKQLEFEAETTLVYRTTRVFKLTASGEKLYQYSKQFFELLEKNLQDLKGFTNKIEGTFKVTAPDDVGVLLLTPIMNEFLKEYPFVKFEVNYSNEILDLIDLNIDFAFRMGPLKDSSLLSKKIAESQFLLAASPDYLSHMGYPEKLTELSRHQFIGFSPIIKQNSIYLIESGKKRKTKIDLRLQANNYFAVKEAVLSGLGIGLVPNFLCRNELLGGKLIRVLSSVTGEAVALNLVRPPHLELTSGALAFRDFVIKRLRERLS